MHKELMTDDEVHIKELNKNYKVKIDRVLDFDYYNYM